MIVLLVIVSALLLFIAGIEFRLGTRSQFERRRIRQREVVEITDRRATLLEDLLSVQRVMISILLVAMAALSVTALGWLIGIITASIIALWYGTVARWRPIQKLSQRLYDMIEPVVVGWFEEHPRIVKAFRGVTTTPHDPELSSREELLHLVDAQTDALTKAEKLLIHHALTFGSQRISKIMTPRSVVETIEKGELLGPLVLDSLHKTGFSRFPVTAGDVDHIVGVLHARDLLTLDTTRKHTIKVETAMERKVYYIHEDQTCEHALAAFLKTRHHLFVVVNSYRETVGILTLEDVIETLLGRKIVDEFDAHDDLRAVAERNPHRNNTVSSGVDV